MNFLKNLLTFLKSDSNSNSNNQETLISEFDSKIIVAQIKEIKAHPNADRLVLVSADIGQEVVEPIVCGAKNMKVDDKVVLALPGAEIPRGLHADNHESFILEKAKIRGVESQGMLCSAFELGLGDTFSPEEGILILPISITVGKNFNKELLNT